jgi:sec-independent protein translocase protein TatA
MIGSQSLLMVLGVVLLLFGGKKLPELAGSLGKSIKEFRKGTDSGGGEEEAPAARPAVAAPVRACPACRAALEAEWAHCPKCGASTPPGASSAA